MFPLPNVFLLPGTFRELYIFEPRYTRMIEDCLDGPGRIALAVVPEEHHADLAGAPPVHAIGGLGEIARHERQPRGRFRIWLAGLARARLSEVASDKPYRLVLAQPLAEIPPPEAEEQALSEQVRDALVARDPDYKSLPGGVSLAQLADLLLTKLPLAQESMQELYSELRVVDRARGALAAHRTHPRG
jgi:Lon protease-like protein